MMIKQRGKELKTVFGLRIQDIDDDEIFEARVYPHLPFPVILSTGDESKDYTSIIKVMNYSLIPKWSKVSRPKFATYNARIETITEKPTWKEPLRSQHCIVPMNAFYESCYEGTHAGNIVRFEGKNKQALPVAGIWEDWLDKKTGEVISSFAVITREPTGFIKKVGHDRCPLFLSEESIPDWLKPVQRNAEDCKNYLLDNFKEPALNVEIERALKPGWDKRK